MEKVFLLSLGEVFLKGKNQHLFVKKIKSAIEIQLLSNFKRNKAEMIIERQGSKFIFYVEKFLKSMKRKISDENIEKVFEILKKVFGIKIVVLADMYELSADIEKIGDIAYKYVVEKDEKVISLNIKRIEKNKQFKSPDVHKYIREKLPQDKKLYFKSEHKIYVEIANKRTFIYCGKDRQSGVAGLPVSSTGKVVALLSGGIDSPVAVWQMMRRGCEVVAVHFNHKKSHEKIEEIVDKLNEYTPVPVKLIVIDTDDLTKEIIKNFKKDDRMIFFRRIMFKIADEICKIEKAKAIISGDNLAQVASQTLENINAVSFGLNHAVIRPLVGYEKDEIVEVSRKIGLFNLSVKKCADFCSMIVSGSPTTKIRMHKMKRNEDVVDKIVEKILDIKNNLNK